MSTNNTCENETKKKSIIRRFWDSTAGVITFCVAIFLAVHFLVTPVVVVGSSMNPTYEDGNLTFSNRLIYTTGNPERFDVIVFNLNGSGNGLERITSRDSYYLIKRVIGLPGETVRIDANGTIYINDKALEENYGAEQILDPGIAADGITLGEDEYFVLGDTRNHSCDSRFGEVGTVTKEQMVGKIVFSAPDMKFFQKGK